ANSDCAVDFSSPLNSFFARACAGLVQSGGVAWPENNVPHKVCFMAGGQEGVVATTGPAICSTGLGALSDSMRALFEAIDDAVFVHDAAGNILEANPAACRRLGYTRDELLRLNTADIDAPEFAQGFQDRLRTQLRGGSYRCEGVHRTRDGRLI